MGSPRTFDGYWLIAARVIWVIVAAPAIGVFIAGIPDQLHSVDEFSVEQVMQLRRHGVSPQLLANLSLAIAWIESAIFVLIGTIIFYRKSHERAAWTVALMLVTYVGVDFPPALQAALATHPIRAIIGKLMVTFAISLFYLLFFIFPSGRFVPGWTILPALAWGLQIFFINFFWNTPLNNWFWPPIAGALELVVLLPCAVYAQIHRYRSVSQPVERQQMKWLFFGMTTTLTIFVGFNIPLTLGAFGPPDNPTSLVAAVVMRTIFPLGFLAVPATLAIAILRHRLFEIDVIINRALVYGALSVMVIGIYVLVVGYLGAALHDRNNLAISLIATGIVAVLFQPLRERLQLAANRVLYGQRDDPYAVLSQLGLRLEETLALDEVLPAIVETVASALKLPYVAIELPDELERGTSIAAATGVPTDRSERLPLTYGHGALVVASRAPGEVFSEQERQLLRDLARQAGVAVQAVRAGTQSMQLAEDLRQARQRLVTAREAERRRLRRDLHDGLGPRLASMSMRLETARDQLPAGSSAAELMTDLSARMQETVADIRQLVYALRPPALDDLGLVAALSEWAVQLSYGDQLGPGLAITVEASDTIPPLPAAVEVAAYRIVQETLTNVARHSRARRCRVCLEYLTGEQQLRLNVTDDGIGLPEDLTVGVGLGSMRERADELGGSLTIGPATGCGTHIQAVLPCRWDVGADDPLSDFDQGLRA